MKDSQESSQNLLENFLTTSLGLKAERQNSFSAFVPQKLDNFFAERYIENSVPIFIKSGKLLVIGVYCINIDKARVYKKVKPKLMLDFRYWTIDPLGNIEPTRQGLLMPLEIVDDIVSRLLYFNNKFSEIKNITDIIELFDPYKEDQF